MASKFALILAIATLITGIIWCFERFKWAPARKAAATDTASGSITDHKIADAAIPPGWIETCASIFPVLAIVFSVRSFLYEPFQIPSGSMMPTLLIGDFILVEKYAYGIKDPITQTTLVSTGHPKRGDIAVFKYPLNPDMDYIKRVAGVPGDRVIYNPFTRQVTVQPSCNENTRCTEGLTVNDDTTSRPSAFVQTFQHSNSDKISSRFFQIPQENSLSDNEIRLSERTETQGAISHSILIVPGAQEQLTKYYRQPGQPLGIWVVPEGHYFMIGDNRDNSADSRFWGFVPEKNLVGKAIAIWMSFEKQEGEWPTGVRLSRIGNIH